MKTITIQIGNSDDKLRQNHWHLFVDSVKHAVESQRAEGVQIHFHGCSPSDAPWQNACWVFTLQIENFEPLQKRLNEIRDDFKQESIAWTEGETTFIK